MRQLAREGAMNIAVRTAAMDKVAFLPQKDYRAEACRLLTYVRDDVRYVKDIRGVEVLQIPTVTMQYGGDCDDKSILLAALLLSIGHRPRFIAISLLPNEYQHVWVQDFVNGGWLDLEATEPVSCGTRVPKAGVLKELTFDL